MTLVHLLSGPSMMDAIFTTATIGEESDMVWTDVTGQMLLMRMMMSSDASYFMGILLSGGGTNLCISNNTTKNCTFYCSIMLTKSTHSYTFFNSALYIINLLRLVSILKCNLLLQLWNECCRVNTIKQNMSLVEQQYTGASQENIQISQNCI